MGAGGSNPGTSVTQLRLSLESHDLLAIYLCDGDQETNVQVHQARAGADSLTRALGDALTTGYGECFWPAFIGGQYWWIFKRDGDALEVIAMWTRGGVSTWEHVFRARDAAAFVAESLAAEISRLKLNG